MAEAQHDAPCTLEDDSNPLFYWGIAETEKHGMVLA